MAFEADLAALISKARDDGVPPGYLDVVVTTFYRRHGRAIPSPIVPPSP
jgi:hypothetical protein